MPESVPPPAPSEAVSPDFPADHEAAPDAALRADIKALGELLGRTLVRQEGEELFNLVEEVRALTRSDDPADGDTAAARLGGIDLSTAIRLVRAFTSYFYLANVTEQVYRGRELHAKRAQGGSWLSGAVDRIAAAIEDDGSKVTREWAEQVVSYLSVRPVFTAHPTEAARRTILTKLRQIALLLDDGPFTGPEGVGAVLTTGPVTGDPVARRRAQRRLAELIDLLWQTDELRQHRPTPIDEARNVVYYLQSSGRRDGARTDRRAGRGTGPRRRRRSPVDARPLTFGTWIGGDRDGNPNVTAAVTREVLRAAAPRGRPLDRARPSTQLIAELSTSTTVVGVTPELLASIEADLRCAARHRPPAT